MLSSLKSSLRHFSEFSNLPHLYLTRGHLPDLSHLAHFCRFRKRSARGSLVSGTFNSSPPRNASVQIASAFWTPSMDESEGCFGAAGFLFLTFSPCWSSSNGRTTVERMPSTWRLARSFPHLLQVKLLNIDFAQVGLSTVIRIPLCTAYHFGVAERSLKYAAFQRR